MMEYEECVQNIHVYKQHIINLPKNINMYSKGIWSSVTRSQILNISKFRLLIMLSFKWMRLSSSL